MGKCKSIMLLITYSCNLNCTYCYEPKRLHKRMSKEHAISYIQEVVHDLDSSYTEFEVQFMGGEPFLEYELIHDVSEWLWEWKSPLPLSNIFIATNGTLLSEEMKTWLTRNRERICCGLSFDGDVLMQNVNRPESSSKIDLQFFATNWPNQSVKMTLSPNTVDRLFDGVRYLLSQGLTYIAGDLAMGTSVKWTDDHLNTLSQELQKLSDYYLSNQSLPLFSMLDIDIFSALHNQKNSVVHCGCGDDLVCIDTDGEHYACHLFSPVSLPKSKAKLSQIFDFSNKQNFYSEECNECSIKSICTHCYGMNYYCSGDITKQSPETCKSTKIRYLIACQFQMELSMRNNQKAKCEQIESLLKNIKL